MAFDVKKWLKEDMGFSDEEITDLAPKLEPKADVLEKGHLRQSDYSRHMNDLKKTQDELKAANDRLNAEMAEWAELQAGGEQVTKKMRDDLEAAQLRVTQLTQRVQRIATDAGLDPAKALEGIDQPPPKKEEPPAVDLSGYVKADQLAGLAQMTLTLPATLMTLANDHQTLFGEPLDANRVITELQTRAGTKNNQKSLDPRVIWEELFGVPAKREEKQKAEFDAQIAAAEARGREAALSEASIPVPSPTGRHAPVFQTTQSREGSALKRPQPGSTTQAAVTALRSGKYRQPAAGTAKTA